MEEKVKVVIIHGAYGSPKGNWFQWLASEVHRLGHDAVVPGFPTPEGQNLDNWMRVFADAVGEIKANMILVGHSLGPGFILNLLQDSTVAVRGTFLVSGFLGALGLEEFDPINKSFVGGEFDWPRIRENAGEVHIYNSDNDPYVPLQRGYELAEKFGVELKVVKGGGHINESSGHRSFPQLLDDLRPLLPKRIEGL